MQIANANAMQMRFETNHEMHAVINSFVPGEIRDFDHCLTSLRVFSLSVKYKRAVIFEILAPREFSLQRFSILP